MEEATAVDESLCPLEEEAPAKVPDLEVEEENQVQEMTLDEWKIFKNRPDQSLNLTSGNLSPLSLPKQW